jgi:hypothetical protein
MAAAADMIQPSRSNLEMIRRVLVSTWASSQVRMIMRIAVDRRQDGAAQFVKRSEFAARALEDCAMTAVVRRRIRQSTESREFPPWAPTEPAGLQRFGAGPFVPHCPLPSWPSGSAY